MAIQNINVGNIANDGTGDDLREAFIKVNANFTDIDSRVATGVLSATNRGVTGEGIYYDNISNTLQFKRIVPGANTQITSNNDTITISSTGGLTSILVLSDNGSVNVGGGNYLGIEGRQNINTSVSGQTVFVDVDPLNLVEQDVSPRLGGTLDANQKNIINADTISAGQLFGNLSGLVHGIDIRPIYAYFDQEWDFGPIINRQFNSLIDYVLNNSSVDMGGFVGSDISDTNIDLGTIA